MFHFLFCFAVVVRKLYSLKCWNYLPSWSTWLWSLSLLNSSLQNLIPILEVQLPYPPCSSYHGSPFENFPLRAFVLLSSAGLPTLITLSKAALLSPNNLPYYASLTPTWHYIINWFIFYLPSSICKPFIGWHFGCSLIYYKHLNQCLSHRKQIVNFC